MEETPIAHLREPATTRCTKWDTPIRLWIRLESYVIVYEPICPDITLYSARYSFGSIAANDLDISERTIGMCLGHSWANSVTCRYIANDQNKIDKAVKAVIDFFLAASSS